MTIVVVRVLVAIAFAVLARRLRGVGSEVEALVALGVALAIVVPWPTSVAIVVTALVLAAIRHRAQQRIERERDTLATYFASIRVESAGIVRGAQPAVDDALARRAIDRLVEREAELVKTVAAERAPPRVPAGVRARFMAAMGHELRSPLNSITGFAQLLEDGSEGPLNEAQRENVVLVRRASSELLTLLTDILDTARIEAGRVTLERHWIAPIEVLTLALSRAREHPETEALAIEAELQPGLEPLFVDRGRLAQALVNVLRAVGRSGTPLTARVREVRHGETSVVRFEVHDRSYAISDADAARAFDPDPAARAKGRSLALGLALSVARDLAQLHGGDARAEAVGRGTSWIVWVPAETTDEPRSSDRYK